MCNAIFARTPIGMPRNVCNSAPRNPQAREALHGNIAIALLRITSSATHHPRAAQQTSIRPLLSRSNSSSSQRQELNLVTRRGPTGLNLPPPAYVSMYLYLFLFISLNGSNQHTPKTQNKRANKPTHKQTVEADQTQSSRQQKPTNKQASKQTNKRNAAASELCEQAECTPVCS